MNETIVGGIIALFGVLIGGVISLGVEFIRNNWRKSERNYQRIVEIVDRRCDQAENYAKNVTADFRNIMGDIEIYLLNVDQYEAKQRSEARIKWKDHLDTTIFSLGPAIKSLSDDELMTAWDEMMNVVDDLQKLYGQVWEFRFEGRSLTVENPLGLQNEYWITFSGHLSDFYKRLDRIRFDLTEEKKINAG